MNRSGRTFSRLAVLVVLFCAFAFAKHAAAEKYVPPPLKGVGFDQRLGSQVPLDATFVDENGRPVKLGEYFGERPVILVLAYYRCPMLCNLVLNGVVLGMLDIPFELGRDYRVVTISFDARETPQLAAAKKKTYVERYGYPERAAGWAFLTGGEDSIRRVADAVGFHYVYDPKRDEFAHASGIVLLTPSGKASRYFYDVKYSPRDLRLGLVEASEHKIGSPVDRVLLFCFHYDPASGKYGAAVMNFVRAGGVLTLASMCFLVGVLVRQDRRRRRPAMHGPDESRPADENPAEGAAR